MAYFLRRFGFFVLTLWAAVTLNFLIPRLQPGDPAQAMAARLTGQNQAPNPTQIHAISLMLGLPHTGLLTQYWQYLGSVATLNFGYSYTYFPYSVTHTIAQALPWTLVLVGVTQIIGFAVGTVLGAFAAAKRNSAAFDSVVSLGSTFLGTLPFFWIALLLLYVFAFVFPILPQGGGYSSFLTPNLSMTFILDAAFHSILPAVVLLITAPIGWIMSMRNNMVQILGADYTRLARAKGLTSRRIVLNYSARNAILPNLTGFAMALGTLIGGQVFVEEIFRYPGMGLLLFQAIGNKDYPLMQAVFLLLTVGVLVANLIADFLYGVLDPRVRRAGEA